MTQRKIHLPVFIAAIQVYTVDSCNTSQCTEETWHKYGHCVWLQNENKTVWLETLYTSVYWHQKPYISYIKIIYITWLIQSRLKEGDRVFLMFDKTGRYLAASQLLAKMWSQFIWSVYPLYLKISNANNDKWSQEIMETCLSS